MSQQRMAGEEIMSRARQLQADFTQYNNKAINVMERQRQRDVAAAYGEIIPFTKDDII